jgi:hypothetical protein
MDEIPAGSTFQAIVAINVFEHVYDIAAFLRAVRNVLAPGGTFFISTPNAISLEASALGTWWSMCKVHDHVSFPSPAGLTMAARESGLRVGRIWSTELPFEFPVSVLTSARDRVRAQGGSGKGADGPQSQVPAGAGLAGKAALGRFYAAAGPFDPVARVLGALGRAGSIKARLTL